MGWIASLHGSTDHLNPAVADEIETAVRDALASVMGQLVPAGHQSVAGVFHYSKGSPSDLRDATPRPDPSSSEAPAPVMGTSPVPPEVHDVGVPAGTAP